MADTAAPETKPEKIKMPEQNGITRPKPGTQIDKVWKTADDLSNSLQRPATRAEVRDAIGDTVNPATFATQYARWTKFYGVGAQIKQARSAEAEAKKASADAAKAEKAAERDAKKAEKAKEREERKAAREQEKAAKQAAAQAEREAAAKAKAEAEAAKAAEQPAAEVASKSKGGKGKAKPAEPAPAAA